MNKILGKIIAFALAAVCVLSLVGCSEVKNGSKIERIQIEVEYTDAEGNKNSFTAEAELYLNFAEKTIAQFKKLIADGYYKNVDITNATSGYVSFGDYKFDADGKFTAIDQNVPYVEGEFLNNGHVGNRLTASAGALILKRSSEAGKNGESKYDTGKATIAVCLGSSAFSADEYCVFGMLRTDDNDSSADEDSFEYLSSLGRMQKLATLESTEAGEKVYYCISDKTDDSTSTESDPVYNWKKLSEYVTYGKYSEEMSYYKGKFSFEDIAAGRAEDAKMTDEEREDFVSKLTGNDAEFYTLPVYSAVIKSVSLLKK